MRRFEKQSGTMFFVHICFVEKTYPEVPFGEEIHKKELYRLCDEILNECTVQKIRYSAMDVLTVLYLNDGMME